MWCENKNIPLVHKKIFPPTVAPHFQCFLTIFPTLKSIFYICIAIEPVADKKITYQLDADYRLIGLATGMKEYKLCFHLNRLLGCDFQKLPDLIFEAKDRTRSSQFSVLKAGDESSPARYFVFGNKNMGEYLLPEFSDYDYLIQVPGNPENETITAILEAIRSLPEVALAAEIPLKKAKSKDRLIYNEEKEPVKRLTRRKI